VKYWPAGSSDARRTTKEKIMEEKFLELVAEALEKEQEEMAMADPFRDYEEWDSLAVLSIIAMIKQNYDITIPRQEFDQLVTLADMYGYISSKA